MAKKKTKDTKGLAGVIEYGKSAASGKDIRLNKKVKPANQGGGPNYLGEVETVTVPKQWLSSPDHVVAELAYITPAEQKILLEANLYGSLDGVPNRGPGGLMSLQGDMSGGSYSGGAGDDPAGTDSAADAAGSSSGSSSGSTDGRAGDTDTSDAETDDPDTRGDVSDSYRGSVGTGFGYYGISDYGQGVGKTTKSQRDALAGTRGRSYGDESYAFQDKGRDRMYGGATKAQLEELARRDSMLSNKIQEQIKAGNVYDYVIDPKTGLIGGVTHKQSGFLGNLGNTITGLLGLEGLVLGDRVYTGRSDLDPFDIGGGRDGGDDRQEKKVAVTVTDAIVSATPTSPPSYYGQGVGTATTNLYDPTKIDPYLASLYGITPSPIGATYDAATSSYYMPGSKKDAKSRTRLRGLDIFKPVSIVS